MGKLLRLGEHLRVSANEFVITIPRNSNQAQSESNLVTRDSNQVGGENEPKSNQVDEKVTNFART